MNIFKTFVNQFVSKDGEEDDTEEAIERSARAPKWTSTAAQEWADVSFDTSLTQEANLYLLWQQTEARRVDASVPRGPFNAFLREFATCFDTWLPDEELHDGQQLDAVAQVLGGSAADGRPGSFSMRPVSSLRSAGSFTSRPLTPRSAAAAAFGGRSLLVGCKLGHPKAIIEAMVSCLPGVVVGLAEAMSKEQVKFDQLLDMASLPLLQSLVVVMRSHHNRFAVLSLRGVEGLAELLKVVNLRLNGITALTSVESTAYAPRDWQLSLLQCVAALITGSLHNYICGEIGTASHPTTEGGAVDFDKLERVVRPLVQCSLLTHYIELIRLLGLLRGSGAACGVQYQVEGVVLTGCAVALAHSITAQHHLRTSGSLDVLLDRLGWPQHMPSPPNQEDSRNGPAPLAVDEFRSQLSALNVLGAAIRRNRNNLRYMRDHGGFQRIVHMIQWVVATFHTVTPYSCRGPDADDSQLSGPLLKVFAILQSWVTQTDDAPGPVINLTDSLAKDVVEVLLSIFSEATTKAPVRGFKPELHAHVLHLVRNSTCALQLHILTLMNQLVAASPTAVTMLRKLQVKDVLFGPGFFYFAADRQQVDELEHSWISLQAPTSPGATGFAASRLKTTSRIDVMDDPAAPVAKRLDALALKTIKSLLPYPKAAHDRARLGLRVVNDVVCGPESSTRMAERMGSLPQRTSSLSPDVTDTIPDTSPTDRLRKEVVQLMEIMALSAAGPAMQGANGEIEVTALLRALETGVEGDWQAVLLSAAALQRLIKSPSQDAILQVLSKQGALQILANAVVQVQAAADGLNQGSKQQVLHQSAQEALLQLLGAFLETSVSVRRIAMRNPLILKALFAMVWDEALRSPVLRLMTDLMDVPPQGDTERIAKLGLFCRFAELLPLAKQQWRQHGISLVVDLLSATQDIIRRSPDQHQALLREAGFTTHLVSLLDDDYPGRLALSICEHVLTTLQVLLARNQASRDQLKTVIGYNTLCNLILKCASGGQPGKALLLQVLGLVVEEDFDLKSNDQNIANLDAVVLFFRLVQHSLPSVQVWGLDAWMQLLSRNLANQAACQKGSVNAILVDWLATCSDLQVQDRLAQLLQITGAYSISPRDLRGILNLLRGDQRSVPRHSGVVLRMLNGMIKPSGPPSYFHLSTASAGIFRTEPMRWPSKGITVSMWVRTDGQLSPSTQSIFSFICKRSHGISGLAASLHDDHLTLRSQQDRKTQRVVCTFQMERKRWYHLIFSHNASSLSLSSAMAKVYIDGVVKANVKLRYPTKPEFMNSVTFGAALGEEDTGINASIGAWTGQLGSICVLEDAVNDTVAKTLYALEHEFQGVCSSSQMNSASQGKESLASRLVCAYHPCAWSEGVLVDLSQFGPKGGTADTPVTGAEMLAGTSVHQTTQLHNSLQCLGGVDIFLPLVEQLDLSSPPATPNNAAALPPSRLVDIVSLMYGILKQHPASRMHWVKLQGFAQIAYMLEQRHPSHLDVSLLEKLETMAARLSGWAPSIAYQFFEHLLVNFRLWSQAPFEVQQRHQQLLLQLSQSRSGPVLKVLTATSLLHALRLHYWTTQTSDSGAAAGGGLLQAEEVGQLRRSLLSLVSSLATSGNTQQVRLPLVMEDVEAWMAFLGDCTDARMVEDVISQLCILARPSSPCSSSLQRHILALGGPKLLLPLLQREPAQLRLAGLRLLAVLVHALTPAQLAASLGTGDEASAISGFWAAVSDALMMNPLQQGVRNALLDLLLSTSNTTPSRSPISSPRQMLADALSDASKHAAATDQQVIVVPAAMGMLCRLLLACSNREERTATLRALAQLLQGSKKNLEAVLAQSAWHCWLLDLLLDGSPCNTPGAAPADNSSPSPLLPSTSPGPSPRIRTAFQWHTDEAQIIRGMLRNLYVHAMLHLPHGWQHLRNSAAYLQGCSSRGVVDGWGLVHHLLADVLEVLVGPDGDGARKLEGAGGPEAWTVVLGMLAGPARQNSVELLGLLDSLLSGVLVTPGGEGKVPWSTALNWAFSSLEDDTPDAWSMLGASMSNPMFSTNSLTPTVWRLHSNVWKLLRVMRASPDGFALPQKLQGVLSRSIAPLQESGVFRQLRNSPASSPILSPETLGGQTPEAVITSSMQDRPLRLAVRMLLLSLQFAPEEHAEESMQGGRSLIPRLLSQSPQAHDRLHLLLSLLLRTKNLMSAADAAEMQQAVEEWRRCLCKKALEGMLQDVWPLLQNSVKNDSQTLAALGQVNEGRAAAVLRHERIVRCLRAEVQFMAWMANAASNTQVELERQAEVLSVGEHQQLKAVTQQAKQELASVCSANRVRRARIQLAWDEQRQSVAKALKQLQRKLTGETGIWGRADARPRAWKLDMHEDRLRRRLVMKPNYNFIQYVNPQKGQGYCPASILASAASLKGTGLGKVGGGDNGVEDDGTEEAGFPDDAPQDANGGEDSGFAGRWEVQAALGASILGNDVPVSTLQEPVLFNSTVKLISPKGNLEAKLELTQTYLHVYGELAPDSIPAAPRKPTPGEAGDVEPTQPISKPIKKHYRYQVSKMVEILQARYMLQPTALEIFFVDGSNILLNFASWAVAEDCAAAMCGTCSHIRFLDNSRKREAAYKQMQRWQRWEISNFEYIMHLNKCACRTYNDLNQYPVFPWILADYTSPSLNLHDPATFRDLSKPIGAASEKRRQFFMQRFDSMKGDPDVAPFHYGSHYSSSAIILYYMIRLEPFTALNRHLQGGRFDHADRLFQSIPATWQCVLENTADVKELIPEFFYLPDFLRNSNQFDLGTRQDGVRLDDVILPQWANGSPEEFVRIHREALESEYVSEHLHEWINLVFGYKQRGPEAEKAVNVFYHLTYEGAVDLASIDDEMSRRAIADQITNFGQTPGQLFKKRHPKRGPPPGPALRPLFNGPDVIRLAAQTTPNGTAKQGAAQHISRVQLSAGRVIMVTADRCVSCHRWLAPKDMGTFTFSSGTSDLTYDVELDGNRPRMLGPPGEFSLLSSSNAWTVLPGTRVLVSCAYWDRSIKLHSCEDGRLLQSVCGHQDIVTVVSASPDGQYLVSGSADSTVAVWELIYSSSRSSRGVTISAAPQQVLHGHKGPVCCVAGSADLDVVVSGSTDGTIVLYSLSKGTHRRSLTLPAKAIPSLLALNVDTAMLVVHSHSDCSLHAVSVSGVRQASLEVDEKLSALELTWDGKGLLCGGEKGVVVLRALHSLEVVMRWEERVLRTPITSISATPEDCFIVGTADGQMLVYTPDPRRRITKRMTPVSGFVNHLR